MQQKKIKRVVVHTEGADRTALAERVNAYHVDVIGRKLHEVGLSLETQMEVVNGIIAVLRKKER